MKAADLADEGMNDGSAGRRSGWRACFLRCWAWFMILPVFALYAEHLRGNTAGAGGTGHRHLRFQPGAVPDSLRVPVRPLWPQADDLSRPGDFRPGQRRRGDWPIPMWGVILGRALQGGGAVSAAVMALAGGSDPRGPSGFKVMAVIASPWESASRSPVSMIPGAGC